MSEVTAEDLRKCWLTVVNFGLEGGAGAPRDVFVREHQVLMDCLNGVLRAARQWFPAAVWVSRHDVTRHSLGLVLVNEMYYQVARDDGTLELLPPAITSIRRFNGTQKLWEELVLIIARETVESYAKPKLVAEVCRAHPELEHTVKGQR